MADERKPNIVKRVAWHLVAKNLLKFVDDEASYKLTDKVLAANDFTKYPLSKGTLVEVGIIDNTITYLRKQKSDAPKAESHGSEEAYEPTPEEEAGPTPKVEQKVEAPKIEAPTSDAKELTVYAIAANKKVVKFLEIKDDGWYQIAENIQAQDYKVIGLEAKNRVKVTFNDKLVTSLVRVTSEPAETTKTTTSSPDNAKSVQGGVRPDNDEVYREKSTILTPKKEWKPSSSYDTADRQRSIEAQAAVNSANEVAGKVAASISPAPTANVINNMIRAVAESNFALIQELKSK